MSYSIIGPLQEQEVALPLHSHQVPTGFPSPAADHLEKHISLDELFEIRAPHVYLVKIEGDSMMGAEIYSGDLVIVDRIREAQHGDIVIAALNSEPLCKRLHGDPSKIRKKSYARPIQLHGAVRQVLS